MDGIAVYTKKEDLVASLKRLEALCETPYERALHEVLVELSGMACEAATYTAIVKKWMPEE